MKAYDDYFSDIVTITDEDYVLGDEKINAERTMRYSNALLTSAALLELDEKMMARIFSAYTESFVDSSLYMKAPKYLSEREVQAVRKGEYLYVLRSNSPNLKPGMRITEVDYAPVSVLAGDNRDRLLGDCDENEAWDIVLRGAQSVEIEENGKRHTVSLPDNEKLCSLPEADISYTDGSTVIFSIPTLKDPQRISSFAEKCRASGKKRLIIDLRGNSGGLESALYPLMRFITDKKISIAELLGDRYIYTNYSSSNCDRLIASLASLKKTDKPSLTAYAESAEREIWEKYGAGIVREKLETEDMVIEPSGFENITILTDGYTANECARFCDTAHGLGYAKIIGRPCTPSRETMTRTVYNVTENIKMIYPVSVTERGYNNRGGFITYPVDELIRFSEREITEDILLNTAINT